jgi:hypothetical protein
MFHVPYKFRRQTEYCTPKGPNIKRAPWLLFSINGTEIKLKVPGHKSRAPIETCTPQRHIKLQKHFFSRHINQQAGWDSMALITRSWDFNGAWFIGKRASMDMHAVILTPTKLNSTVSFFHPRAFEGAIADFMTYYYGADISAEANTQDWFAPKNWKTLLTHPCIAKVAGDRMDRYLFFPLSDQHILMIDFPISRSNVWLGSNQDPERDTSKWINNAPMEQLATDIINSLQISLSPEAKQQQEKALAGLADTSLVKEFAPIKWV